MLLEVTGSQTAAHRPLLHWLQYLRSVFKIVISRAQLLKFRFTLPRVGPGICVFNLLPRKSLGSARLGNLWSRFQGG